MAAIARRLSDQQIDDVTAYFASLPPAAAAAGPQRGGEAPKVQP
jgi:cytochrome c553